MKFKGIVIGLLSAILVVNTVMAGVLVTEAKKQTQYEKITANTIVTMGLYDTGLTVLESYRKDMTEIMLKQAELELGVNPYTGQTP